MAEKNGSGLSRIIKAGKCSVAGLKAAFRQEQAFRQELVLCLFLVPIAFQFGKSGVEKALLTGSLLLVLLTEIINSAIEAVVDRIGQEMHPLSGLAKDLGSAAVFLALSGAALTWLLVLI